MSTLYVIGMHRSGTSLVAGLARIAGAYFGPEEELMPPAPDNPKGFYEHLGAVDINVRLLRMLGGSWDEPPPFPRAWLRASHDLEDLREEAGQLLARLHEQAEGAPVAIKDPRLSLTLPFWSPLSDDPRVALCVRDPRLVADSLARRNDMSTEQAMRLWLTYNLSAVTEQLPDAVVDVSHTDEGWIEKTLAGLAGLLDASIAEDAIVRANAFFSHELLSTAPSSHSRDPVSSLADEVYESLRRSNLERVRELAVLETRPWFDLPARQNRMTDLQGRLDSQTEVRAGLRQRIQELGEASQRQQEFIRRLAETLEQRESALGRQSARLAEMERRVRDAQETRRQLESLSEQLRAAHAEVAKQKRRFERLASRRSVRAALQLAATTKPIFRLVRPISRLVRQRLREGPPQVRPVSIPSRVSRRFDEYRDLVERSSHKSGEGRRAAFLCSTKDLDEGRGDLFVALGLALELESLGWSCVILGPEGWYDPPSGTDTVVAMIAESEMMVDPARFDPSIRTIAWVRNNTKRWFRDGQLPLYDHRFASSERTRNYLARRLKGLSSELLPIAVDPALFRPRWGRRRHVVGSVNQRSRRRRPSLTILGIAAEAGFDVRVFGVHRDPPAALRTRSGGEVRSDQLAAEYGRALAVVDDQQFQNAAFGNVNSRVFEAIAAGALPICLSDRGLAELGLEEVPTARSGAELVGLLRQMRTGEVQRRRLVRRLRKHVLQHHTYGERARQLHDDVSRPVPPSEATTIVSAFPDYTATNPFLRMVYRPLVESGTVVRFGDDPGDLEQIERLARHRRILHVHWTKPVMGPAKDADQAREYMARWLGRLDSAIASGVQLVWTVHNVLPHDAKFPELESELCAELATRATKIHVLGEGTFAGVGDLYPLPREKTVVVPHPSYVGVYPDAIEKGQAREHLGISRDRLVLLAFGQIRPYKGLDRLLDAWEASGLAQTGAVLLVAGSPGRERAVAPLLERARSTVGVDVRAARIQDVDVQLYFRACDVVVLPHHKVLNSGVALLALSFGRSLIAPRTGNLPEVIGDGAGKTFGSEEELIELLRSAVGLREEPVQTQAFRRAIEFDVEVLEPEYTRLLLGEPPASRRSGTVSG